MNTPLPDHIRLALETASLDDKPHSGLRRRHIYRMVGAAEHAGFGDERGCTGSAL